MMRTLYRIASWLIFLPLLGILMLVITLQWTLHPSRTAVRMSPKAYGLHEENVTFVSEDGFELRAWFISGLSADDIRRRELKAIQARRPTVILCHDLYGVRDQMLPMAKIFYEAGYNCLLFDFRGHGESGGGYTSFGLREKRDVLAAVSYVRQRAADMPWIDPQRVVVFGVGMGAVAAMTAATEDPHISAVIADTPFQSLDEEFRRRTAGRLPASDFFASVYKLGFNCWFQDSADSVDARRAARRLRGRPLMIIAPPNGARGAKNARAVFDAAGADQAILTVAAGEAGLRWMDDPAAISERLKGFLRQVAGWADPDEADEADPLALQPATPTANSPQPPPAG